MKIDKRAFSLINVIVIVSASLVLYSFLNISSTGFSIYDKANNNNQSIEDYLKGIDLLKTELGDLGSGIDSCYDLNNNLLDRFEAKSLDLLGCEKEKERLNQTRITQLQEKNDEIQKILQDNDAEIQRVMKEKKESVKNISDINDDEINALEDQINDLESQIENFQGDLDDKNKEYTELQINYNNLVTNMGISVCCKAKFDNFLIKYYKVSDDKIICSTQSGINLSCSF